MTEFGHDAQGNGALGNALEDDNALLQALEELKAMVEKEEDKKSRLVLEKLDAEDLKKEANKEMLAVNRQADEQKNEFTQTMRRIKGDISQFERSNSDLEGRLKTCLSETEANRAKSAKLMQKFKIHAQIPEKKVKFTGKLSEESGEDSAQSIRAVFTVTQRPSLLLGPGQALITFEEEKVASQILRMAKCSVACDNKNINVKPRVITLDPSVKFEIHIDVSKKSVRFSSVPATMEEKRTRDRLEMSFSRPSRGGGEVEKVDYDRRTGTGQITFLNTGVAESLALKRKYLVDVEPEVKVNVGPAYDYQLKKFQSFCGVPKRTVLLEDIDDVEDEEELQDYLEIHFQKPSNYGGEVESIKYTSSGKTEAFFSDDVVKKEA